MQPASNQIAQKIGVLLENLRRSWNPSQRQLVLDLQISINELITNYESELISLNGFTHCRLYSNWSHQYFGKILPYPSNPVSTSFGYDDDWGKLYLEASLPLIAEYEQHLIKEIATNGVQGAIVEFGVFQGYMLGKLIEECERIDFQPLIYGFDSFEGLSLPSADHDHACWHEGQFKANFDMVYKALDVEGRSNVSLIKGFFEESLKLPEANSIQNISYARIDCDIYQPTVECLEFIASRLSPGSILVFDDWCFDINKGETKAFHDWLPTVPHLRFEFLANWNSRFYLRCLHER